ncbi:hypothetical protein DNTS_021525 [Danionella cerebrum]|uniref:Uncharacterized protein n=1 Tax=Danionella cerebrum TaxID=2873325 RepID=A0A553QI99_9TELE|nr:hypothetical protein DNTS_021525 [Danionella translucida]
MKSNVIQRYSVARKSTSSRSSTGHRVTSSSGRLDRPVYAPTNAIPVQLRNNNPLNSYPSTRSAPELGLGVMNSRAVVQKASAGNGTFSKFTNGSGISSIKTTSRRPASLQSNGGTVIRREQVKDVSGMNGEKLMAELTMREAVDYLFSPEESFQLFASVSLLVSQVLTLKGILPLVNLLGSGSPQIQETVAAALRNAVFKNQPNKEEVQRSGGITQATQMLVDASSEMQKHLTGLKQDLLRLALPTLTEKVLEPFTASRDDNANTGLAPEVFYNATACLRNLSASKLVNRQAMRNCRGLIDSLISYMEHCVNAGTPDNQVLVSTQGLLFAVPTKRGHLDSDDGM